MIQKCLFNPVSDIEEVLPELAPNISEMMATHVVPATDSVDSPYSNETSIDEVGHYLRDKIDIAIAAKRLNASLAEKGKAAASAAAPESTSGENA